MADDVSARNARGTRPMLELAAESIAAVSGVAETVVDVLHGRALRHYADALRQYLAIRVGTVEAANAALGEVRAVVAAREADELVKPPGIRARLYRIARAVAASRKPDEIDRAALPWRPVRIDAPGGQSLGIGKLRIELSVKEAELLELRYARELDPAEIAHVLDATAEEVEQKLEAARVQARFMLGASPAADLAPVLIEAFALEMGADTVELEEREAIPAGTVVGGRYEIDSRVGSGSFADVYRAKDTEVPGHVVALKLLHQASLSEHARGRALRELHLIASVFHPSVVQFKDHGWWEQRLWFVMPWYEGETLEARIDRQPLDRSEARRIFTQLAEALATMHAVGIRHQDVKPDNIFLARIGHAGGAGEQVLPVLLDLGVAAKEAEMIVAGTPTYFAPEVAAQFASGPKLYSISSKSDVFSLALALRNSLEPSTQDDVPAGAVEHFIEHRSQHPPDLPAAEDLAFLRPSFERWLSVNPNERPTAEQLAAEMSILTRPEERREKRNKLLRWLVPSVIAIAVAFGAVIYVLNRETALERLEAERARTEAADALADLGQESERRQALEEDVERIRENLSQSRLSREQLTDRLAETEGQRNQARILAARQQRVAASLRDDLASSRAETDRVRGELGTARSELTVERARVADLGTQLERARDEIASMRDELNETHAEADRLRNRVTEIEAEAATLRSQRESERARGDVLERRIAEAESARTRAEADLEAARRRIATLERELARRGAGGGEAGGDPGGESPGTEPAPTDPEPPAPGG